MGKKSPKRSPKKATSKRSASQSKKTAKKKAPVQKTEPVEFLSGQAAAARHWGVSVKTIQTWIQNGLPVSGSARKQSFDLTKCEPWVNAYRSERSDGDSHKLNEELKKAKLREQVLKNEKLEREKEIAEGNLVDLNEYVLFASELVIEARDQMLTVPKEIRRHLCKKCQKKVVQELTMIVEQTLQRLAAVQEGPKK